MNKIKNIKKKAFNTLKKISSGALCSVMAAAPALAAGGGLPAATNALTDIKVWLYSFVGIAAIVYLLYNILMALGERKNWSDVGMALGYCALAGGALIGGEWALGLFK
ncbi:TrbC/VirB2 family protein [Plesiomonas sp. PI-19]|uniref:TrbC/VirB2 family protein n=1 Tax=Plesiomonas sp. PI-19 TaxID=2898798 RepID=UPI001F2BB736|nr:TrbC/VirB2 family protein [Plesiomonas sp. PI-19]MCE5165620.1 TrbC/VirB2 family protein [Plesiomonas sp. PI-19]